MGNVKCTVSLILCLSFVRLDDVDFWPLDLQLIPCGTRVVKEVLCVISNFCSLPFLNIHCVSKTVPTFKLSVTLSNRNRFSKFLHCWKAYEICYKTPCHYPLHLRCVATLPWDIKKSNFLQIFNDNTRYWRKCNFWDCILSASILIPLHV